MNKRVFGCLVLLFIVIMLINGVMAANETEDDSKVEKAYDCLKKQIDGRDSRSFQEAVFGVMALGKYDGLFDDLTNAKASSTSCWPSTGCKVKETAQAAIAYNRAGEDNSGIIDWLLTKNGTATELAWYLEIDVESQKPSSCSIRWDSSEYKIKIGSDMRLNSNGGSAQCLSISPSGYLLKIKSDCLSKTFEVSCNETFLTSLIYQKNSGDNSDCLNQNDKTCYVSGETHSAASLGTTQEQVVASCFKNGNVCDYEGTLWATTALLESNEEVGSFVPYILAMSDDNPKYFPDAFITFLTGDDVSYSNVISLRREGKYWDVPGEANNRYFDTSLGLLALSNSASSEDQDATRQYLFDIQGKDGCWNNGNIRDTSFLLYSGWKRAGISSTPTKHTTGCLEVSGQSYSCELMSDCQAAGGQVLDQFECGGISKCCSLKIPEQTCSQLGGKICQSDEECTGVNRQSGDGSCCVGGDCQEVQVDQCTQNNGICKSSCSSDESEQSYSCSSSIDVCCIANESPGGYGWLIILMILILIVVLAIVFRNKIHLWWFKFRSGVKTGNKPSGPSGGMPMQRMQARPMMPMQRPMPMAPRGVPPRPAPAPSRSKELDDTLKKLREMSK